MPTPSFSPNAEPRLADRRRPPGERPASASIPHGDVAALEACWRPAMRATKIVATDSVFSMDGDLAPLPELLALCERHGAWLVVDDAHGFGVLGEQGRGALEHFGLRSPNMVYVGTLGKAAGVGGRLHRGPRQRDRTDDPARPPLHLHDGRAAGAGACLLTSLDIITSDEGAALRSHLRALIAQLDARPAPAALAAPASNRDPADHHRQQRRSAARGRRAVWKGLWVPAIRPPTVPKGTARLRVTLSAAHTHDEVAQLAAALNELEGCDMNLNDPQEPEVEIAVPPRPCCRSSKDEPAGAPAEALAAEGIPRASAASSPAPTPRSARRWCRAPSCTSWWRAACAPAA
jgi:hypothetical protein